MRAMLLSRAAIAAQVASGGNLAAAGEFSTPTPAPAARASLARRTNPLRLQPSRVAWCVGGNAPFGLTPDGLAQPRG